MAEFFSVNDWLDPTRVYEKHERYIGGASTLTKKCLEFILGGSFGNFIEKLLRRWLVKKINNSKKLGYKPRVFWGDEKLELYRDTKRIEEMLERGEL